MDDIGTASGTVAEPASGPSRAGAARHPSAAALIGAGTVIGLTWAAAFRAYMAEIAEGGSRIDWYGTYVGLLLAGVVAGAGLGWAEYLRQTGGRRHWRWTALFLLAFTVLPLTLPNAIVGLVTQGLGGGALAVTGAAIAGGFALTGLGRLWARILCGLLAVLVIAGVAGVAFGTPGRLANDLARGAWVAILGAGCVAVLCLASSIPFRPVVGRRPPRASAGRKNR